MSWGPLCRWVDDEDWEDEKTIFDPDLFTASYDEHRKGAEDHVIKIGSTYLDEHEKAVTPQARSQAAAKRAALKASAPQN